MVVAVMIAKLMSFATRMTLAMDLIPANQRRTRAWTNGWIVASGSSEALGQGLGITERTTPMRNGMENETRGNEGLRCRHCSRLCPARSTKSRELAKGRRTIVTAEFFPSNYRFVFLHRCDEHGRLVGQVRLRWQTSGETRWACLKRALFSQRPFHETSPSTGRMAGQ